MLNEQDVYLFPFCPGEVYVYRAHINLLVELWCWNLLW